MSETGKSPDPKLVMTVETLLATAGLAPNAEELAVFVTQYPAHRASIELLHALPDLRYESPALIFTATPAFGDWGAPA
jgi:hypothetical protein